MVDRLVVLGSSRWTDVNRIEDEMLRFSPGLVIHGSVGTVEPLCGADRIACRVAQQHLLCWFQEDQFVSLSRYKADQALVFGALYRSYHRGRESGRCITNKGIAVKELLAFGIPVRWVASPEADAVDLVDMPADNMVLTCHCYECQNLPEMGINNPANQYMILCPMCGNKRCPHATSHQHACSGSNAPEQVGSSYGISIEQALQKLSTSRLQIHFDQDYGIDHRTGWSVSLGGVVKVELVPTLQEALNRALGFQ